MDPAIQPDRLEASYDDIPYETVSHAETHPDALATAATLLGMQPAQPDQCRVLELGCATGANLIPMAQSLPGSRFLGVDLSARQIASGQAVIDAVGLSNIELRKLDILQIDDSFGRFDYIICHGTFSWVPAPVQDKILEICSRNLTAQGVAYLSYNTYPGWHAQGMVRDMMLFHAGQFTDPQTRVRKARTFLEGLARTLSKIDSDYSRAVREIADWLRPQRDSYVFHDFLEEVNLPLYFHQFVERMAGYQLRHLGEPWLEELADHFSPELQQALQQLVADPARRGQYVDFLVGRTFRRSLVGHATSGNGAGSLGGGASASNLTGLYVAALTRHVSPQPDVRSSAPEAFLREDQATISTSLPTLKAALVALVGAWPAAMPFEALWHDVCQRLAGGQSPQPNDPSARGRLAEQLLKCYQSRLVSLHVRPLPYVAQPSDHPRALPLARFQAHTGQTITNLRHKTVELSPLDRLVLGHLDGNHDPAALLAIVSRAIQDGKLPIEASGQSAPAPLSAALAERIRASLITLAQSALLWS